MRTILPDIIRIAATLLLGLYAGGVAFVVLAPSTGRLPGPAYVRHWQALNHDYGRVMPPLLLTCLAALVGCCVLAWRQGRLPFGLALAATLLTLATVVLTVTRMEPLNVVAGAWDPDRLPADWESVRRRWLTLHTIRTVLAVTAFAVLLTAHAAGAHRSPDARVPAAHPAPATHP